MQEAPSTIERKTLEHQGSDISELSRKPRVSIFVESINGFGHFNVAKEIGKALKSADVEVKIVSSTASSDYAKFDFGDIEHVRLPSLKGSIADAALSQIGLHPARQGAIRKHLKQFQPDVVLTEFYPFMMHYRDADMQTIDAYNNKVEREGGERAKVVSVARDIIHAQGRNSAEGILERIDKYFDEIVVRGDGEFVTLEESQEEWKDIQKQVTYTGNIVAKLPEREDMPFKQRPVMVNAGGGYHASDHLFYENIIKSRKFSQELIQNPWRIAVSKSMSEDEFEQLSTLVEAENKACREMLGISDPEDPAFRPIELTTIIPAQEYKHGISNAAAAITRGSYNNNFELIRSEIPYVISPRPKKKEQLLRAEKVEEHGFGKALYHKKYTPEELAEALDTEVRERPGRNVTELEFSGADKMAAHLKGRAAERVRAEAAQEAKKEV